MKIGRSTTANSASRFRIARSAFLRSVIRRLHGVMPV